MGLALFTESTAPRDAVAGMMKTHSLQSINSRIAFNMKRDLDSTFESVFENDGEPAPRGVHTKY